MPSTDDDDRLRFGRVAALLATWPLRGQAQLQFALDGEWENAVVMDLRGEALSVEALVEGHGRTLAAEVIWPGPPAIFIGRSFPAGEVNERGSLLQAVTRIRGKTELGPATVLEALSGAALGPAVQVELGAVNAWRSVGPSVLWRTGEGNRWRNLAQLLAQRPDLARCRHPVGVEVGHDRPHLLWYGRQVSGEVDGAQRVDSETVAELEKDWRVAL